MFLTFESLAANRIQARRSSIVKS